jgi:hypothetical protein
VSETTSSFTPRGAAVASFLTHLDALVQREVSAASAGPAGAGRWELEAERIAAEVAGALGSLRTDLQRHRTAFGAD